MSSSKDLGEADDGTTAEERSSATHQRHLPCTQISTHAPIAMHSRDSPGKGIRVHERHILRRYRWHRVRRHHRICWHHSLWIRKHSISGRRRQVKRSYLADWAMQRQRRPRQRWWKSSCLLWVEISSIWIMFPLSALLYATDSTLQAPEETNTWPDRSRGQSILTPTLSHIYSHSVTFAIINTRPPSFTSVESHRETSSHPLQKWADIKIYWEAV